MRQLQLLIQELNERVYNPVGLNILWPRKVAFLFVSQVELPSEEAVADLIRWKSNTMSVSRFLASCAILISVPVIYHIHTYVLPATYRRSLRRVPVLLEGSLGGYLFAFIYISAWNGYGIAL
jgi:hypothetical protein